MSESKQVFSMNLGEPFALVVIRDGKVHVKGPNGQGQCRLDQPHEIGLLITDLMTGNTIGQPPYRADNRKSVLDETQERG